MIKIKPIKLKKVEYALKRLPRRAAEKPFMAFSVLLLLALLLGGLTFYFYSGLSSYPVEPEEEQLEFDKATYQKVLSDWQMRNERFSQIENSEYPDPFKASLTK
jgi:hypothetical protein